MLEILARSTSTSSTSSNPGLKTAGIILAITSGVLIGSSFVFKKKGLLRSQAGGPAGEGVAYLKSALWWFGMILMILGELCNFAAYALVEAIVVTPLGALSVVISAVLASLFLKEKLTFFGWLGCALCVLGSTIIALNGPTEESPSQIREFQKLFISVGFLVFGSLMITASFVIAVFVAPRWGKKNMIWYLLICSMIGGLSVSVTTGLGSAIVTSIKGDNQFKYWFTYFLLGFIAVTLLTEIYYLNVALALFNTAMVTPTYYVIFTFCSMVSTIVLFQGLQAPVKQIITLVMGFLVICVGITVLQLSKVDPNELKSLDRKSTILLQATRSRTGGFGEDGEKDLSAMEDPGVDSIRGSFGAVGSMIRARTVRNMSIHSDRRPSASGDSELRPRTRNGSIPKSVSSAPPLPIDSAESQIKRYQLYDPPTSSHIPTVEPIDPLTRVESTHSKRRPTIKFENRDVVHSYARYGDNDDRSPVHEYRDSSVPSQERPPALTGILPKTTGLPLTLSPPPRIDSLDPLPKRSKRIGSGSQPFHPQGGKKYPGGNGGYDEESQSLWRQPAEQSDDESEMPLEESLLAIRLVPKPPQSPRLPGPGSLT